MSNKVNKKVVEKGNIKLVWEASNFKSEIVEKDNNKWAEISGTALVVGESRNKVNYNIKNLKENNGAEFNFIVSHRDDYDNPDHNVGDGKYILEGEKLLMEGRVRNTPQHPDIVEKLADGLIAPSIHGGAKVTKEKGKVVVENLRIPLVALVNKHARGVEAASIVAAIAESFNDEEESEDEDKEEEDLKEKQKGEKMTEEKNKVDEQLKEKDVEIQKLKEALEKQKKEQIVESIVQVNESLKKEDLMEKTEVELGIIKEYESKIKENEEKKEETDKKEEEPKAEGSAEVPDEEEKKEEKDSMIDSVVVEKTTKHISMNESLRKQLEKEVRESIYR